jgi:ABC-type sugar transport system, permease component
MLICIYPFYYIIIYSFSNPSKNTQDIFLLPVGFSLETYKGIFELNDIYGAFTVSLSRTVLGTIITLICSSFFAYLITKREMYFRQIIYRFLVITMYLNAGLIPWYLTMKLYGLKDNYLLYIIPGAIGAFYIILIKTYIESLPISLEESAMIDGAGYLTIFYKIIVPLSKPILATIAVYAAVGNWNSWNENFFLVNNQKLQTLQLILYSYLNRAQQYQTNMTTRMLSRDAQNLITPQTVRMCITVIATVPIILVYPFLQKYFVKGIMMGAVKG